MTGLFAKKSHSTEGENRGAPIAMGSERPFAVGGNNKESQT